MTAKENPVLEQAERRGNPGAAALLSVIPGAGHIYAGATARGIAWFVWVTAQAAVFYATGSKPPSAQSFLPWAGVLWLWNIVDAFWYAAGRTRSLAGPILLTAAVNFAAGWHITQVDVGELIVGFPKMGHIAAGLLQPDLWQEGRPSPTLTHSLKLIVDTLYMALIGTVLPIPVTMVLSVVGARNLTSGNWLTRSLYAVSRSIMNLLRSIEVIIIAVMMTVAVGIGPFAGVLALAIHGIGAQGKLYSEAIEDIDPGPVEAITATGATWLQRVIYGVLPQVMPQFIAFTMYRWDINVRMATVIGLVGGGGIGYTLYQYINTLQWRQAGTAIWLISIAVILMDWASAVVREKYT